MEEIRKRLHETLQASDPLHGCSLEFRDTALSAHDMSLGEIMSQPDFFTVIVAGVSFRQLAVEAVDIGDEVQLVPDPDNQYDPNAVKVMSGEHWLGFIPRDQAETVKQAIDNGCKIDAKVKSKKKPEGSDSYGLIIELCVNY